MATDEITVYSTTSCPDCWRSKRYLDRQNVPYTWVNINEQPEAAQTVMRINGGNRSVPTIVFPDGSVLVEPSDRELGAKLGLR
jgi:mycoredoxin